MKHREKLRLARRLLTKQEGKDHIPPFQSGAWDKRIERIANKVKKNEAHAKEASRLRKLKLSTPST